MAIQRTFVAIKPDGVQRCLVGEIISRFEKVGLKIIGMKFVHVDADFAKKHYSEHTEKFFYPMLEKYITNGPVCAMVLEGQNAVAMVRKIVGETAPEKSVPGTIRGDYAHMGYARGDEHEMGIINLIHASDIEENAKKEIGLWFSESDLFDKYETVHAKFM